VIRTLLLAISMIAPGPRVVHSVGVAGMAGYKAAILTGAHPGIGVLNPAGSIIWSRNLPAEPTRLSSPGPAGLFQATVKTPAGVHFLAYRVTAQGVESAIAGKPDGQVFGDDGVSISHLTIKVREHDWAHQGAVSYRTVKTYQWSSTAYHAATPVVVPDYPHNGYPTPSFILRPASGDIYLLKIIAIESTEAERETGLMNVQHLDPDEGMLFTWTQPSTDAFWMENTYIPLTVAFLNADNVVIGMDDMAPLSLEYHYAPEPYMSAIEVNQGYFSAHDIAVGSQLQYLPAS